jgi:hypothetical protein
MLAGKRPVLERQVGFLPACCVRRWFFDAVRTARKGTGQGAAVTLCSMVACHLDVTSMSLSPLLQPAVTVSCLPLAKLQACPLPCYLLPPSHFCTWYHAHGHALVACGVHVHVHDLSACSKQQFKVVDC